MTTIGLDRLREIPLFAELSDEGLVRVADIATEIECPAGMVLALADDAGSGMYVVEEGTVVVDLPGGASIELGPGEFAGELTLLVPDATVSVAYARRRTCAASPSDVRTSRSCSTPSRSSRSRCSQCSPGGCSPRCSPSACARRRGRGRAGRERGRSRRLAAGSR